MEITIQKENTKDTIQKENTKDTIKYTVFIEKQEEENNKIYLEAKYSGLSAIQSVEENYTLGLETEKIGYQYQFNNHVNFTDSINIEDFTSQNSMILTDYESEQVDNFLNAVVQRITQVNKQQMEELGLEEDENPIIYMIPSFGIYSSSVAAINSTTEMSELEITTFNNKFEMYESTNLQGVTVKGLLSTISLNNESQDNDRQIKEINFNGEEYEATDENLIFIKEDINTEKSYRVEFEKDQDTGIIYRAVINEK